MTKKVRTILFLGLVSLFILLAPILILYSQGYRFDFGNWKLLRTGGIFLKAIPKQVDIFIDGKSAQKTDFLFGSALISDLFPKKYKIRVEKSGYQAWEKNLAVKAKEVTEAKSIILFPEKINFSILTQNAENFWFSPDGRKTALLESDKNGWALKLYDLRRNIKSHLVEEKDFTIKGADLLDLEWSSDSKNIYLKIGAKEQEKNFVLNLEKSPPALAERKMPLIPENVAAFEKAGNDIYYLDNSGYIFKSDQNFLNPIKKSKKPYPLKQETEYKIKIFSDLIFLQEEKTLYLLNQESGFFDKFFEGIKDIKISPDQEKLAFFSDGEIWLLFLKDSDLQLMKKSGEKMFLAGFSEKIDEIFWLNSDYLIIKTGDKIKIAEVDDRGRIQQWNIAELAGLNKIFFNDADKNLYILSEGNLYRSEI